MRVAFVDYAPWDYDAGTPDERPLGGSQSALCYHSRELAGQGHEVHLINGAGNARESHDVRVWPLAAATAEVLGRCSAVVIQNIAKRGRQLRTHMAPGAPLVLWTQHATDQPAMTALERPEVRDSFDAFAFVSHWQRETYLARFRLPPDRCRVMRNAVGPAFLGLFDSADKALAAKHKPPVLAYTSTPFRGLDVLLEEFPRIQSAVAGVTLAVYSSMRVYQVPADSDEANYGRLYEAARTMSHVKYVGSLPQPQLAEELGKISVLAYPNHFPETSCISVMEALAAGCRVVSSRLGALPETGLGYATLIPPEAGPAAYRERFVAEVSRAANELMSPTAEVRERLQRQLDEVHRRYSWATRAVEWSGWLKEVALRRQRGG